jgi:hypothetical protein
MNWLEWLVPLAWVAWFAFAYWYNRKHRAELPEEDANGLSFGSTQTFGRGSREPWVNVDGTPMCGGVDVKGRPYGSRN